jgi:hypothetical protein
MYARLYPRLWCLLLGRFFSISSELGHTTDRYRREFRRVIAIDFAGQGRFSAFSGRVAAGRVAGSCNAITRYMGGRRPAYLFRLPPHPNRVSVYNKSTTKWAKAYFELTNKSGD